MPLMRRRPLLRAAAVGGGAYAMGKHAERKQAAAPAPAAPGGVSSEDVARLQELGKLREQGILTDEEFAQQKALILGTG